MDLAVAPAAFGAGLDLANPLFSLAESLGCRPKAGSHLESNPWPWRN